MTGRGLRPVNLEMRAVKVRRGDGPRIKAAGTPVSLTKQGLTVACGNGELVLLTQLQAPGGKRMAAPDYFRGHPIEL